MYTCNYCSNDNTIILNGLSFEGNGVKYQQCYCYDCGLEFTVELDSEEDYWLFVKQNDKKLYWK